MTEIVMQFEPKGLKEADVEALFDLLIDLPTKFPGLRVAGLRIVPQIQQIHYRPEQPLAILPGHALGD